jgi:hypothetical protein
MLGANMSVHYQSCGSSALTNEHPLGELVILEILVEHGGVLDIGATGWVAYNPVVQNLGTRSVSKLESDKEGDAYLCLRT